ncbi:MAG: phosphatase [Fibrobacteres bacterium]|nr:phosphatase [Fibrobacterota bacterium]
MKLSKWNAAAAGALMVAGAASADTVDFGAWMEKQMTDMSETLFGVKKPLTAAAPAIATPYRAASQIAGDQLLLAKGLKAEFVTRMAGNNIDQLAFWPDAEHPKFIMACIEGGRQVIGTLPGGAPKYNPSVQRIDLRTGAVVTMLRGLTSCDPIRTTPWGTLVVAEETTDGGLYEFLDPVHTENLTVVDRSTGVINKPDGTPSTQVKKQKAMPVIAFEGVGLTPKGVFYGGDELRPGTGRNDKDGGSIFKFVPTVPYAGGGIGNLDQSPLASGKIYAMQVSCVGNTQQVGQGCEVGNGAWVEVAAATATSDAYAAGATGYYRPEDGHLDPLYEDTAHADAVRFCWTDTQDEGAQSYGEVMCLEDIDPMIASATQRTVVATRFLEGDVRFNQPDNLDFQPKTGNIFVIEDHPNGEIFSCLDDGDDRDLKTDGCVGIASVVDPSAEPTGFAFAADGETAYVSIQHSDDTNMPKLDDYATDDLIKITGFKVPNERHRRHCRRH